MPSAVKRNVPCLTSETSTPSCSSFDKAVIASGPYMTLSNLPSLWRTRSAPCGRTHSFSPASVTSCNMGTFEAAAMEAKETGLKLKPSNRISPLSVPIQRYPSAVCAKPLTEPPGNLVSVVHCSRTYCEGRRLGSSARASVTRPASTIPIRVHRVCLNQQITGGTRICQLWPHFRFLAGYGLDERYTTRCAPFRLLGKAHRR